LERRDRNSSLGSLYVKIQSAFINNNDIQCFEELHQKLIKYKI
jgi:hypothetical protein